MNRSFAVGLALGLAVAALGAANWPSISGSTTSGVVIENGTDGTRLGTAGAPLVTSTGTPTPSTKLGYQQLTSLSTSSALTVPTGATLAVIEVDSVAAKSVRWRDDGTAPTATVGMEVLPGTVVNYSADLAAIRFIEIAASAKLNVSYYK